MWFNRDKYILWAGGALKVAAFLFEKNESPI